MSVSDKVGSKHCQWPVVPKSRNSKIPFVYPRFRCPEVSHFAIVVEYLYFSMFLRAGCSYRDLPSDQSFLPATIGLLFRTPLKHIATTVACRHPAFSLVLPLANWESLIQRYALPLTQTAVMHLC